MIYKVMYNYYQSIIYCLLCAFPIFNWDLSNKNMDGENKDQDKEQDQQENDSHLCKYQDALVQIQHFITGLAALFLLSGFTILSLPVYLYRYILTTWIVPHFYQPEIGEPVSPTGNIFATEFLRDYPTRCAIVSNFVVEGDVTVKEVRDTIKQKWLSMEAYGEPTYPVLQSYIEYWRGFMFWKRDFDSNVDNHLFEHRVPGNGETTEEFMCNLVEHLLNKPFAPRRSPWEIHVVHNYSDKRLQEKTEKPMSAIVMRFHHAVADGYSLLYAVVEKLFGTPLESIQMPTPIPDGNCQENDDDTVVISNPEVDTGVAMEDICTKMKSLIGLIKYVGWYGSLYWRPKSAWHVPDRKKKWKQLYTRSGLMNTDVLKHLKDKFGVSFTGLLFSCISAGISKSRYGRKNELDKIGTFIPLPLAGHPMKFTNHITGTLFDLPVGKDLKPVDRLRECERVFQEAKKSSMPKFAVLIGKLLGSHFAPVARKILRNNVVPMGLSNFPGPSTEISYNGKKGLSADFVAGAVQGVAGVAFMVMSYGQYVRFAATAEAAVMDEDELSELMDLVTRELDILGRHNH